MDQEAHLILIRNLISPIPVLWACCHGLQILQLAWYKNRSGVRQSIHLPLFHAWILKKNSLKRSFLVNTDRSRLLLPRKVTLFIFALKPWKALVPSLSLLFKDWLMLSRLHNSSQFQPVSSETTLQAQCRRQKRTTQASSPPPLPPQICGQKRIESSQWAWKKYLWTQNAQMIQGIPDHLKSRSRMPCWLPRRQL